MALGGDCGGSPHGAYSSCWSHLRFADRSDGGRNRRIGVIFFESLYRGCPMTSARLPCVKGLGFMIKVGKHVKVSNISAYSTVQQ